MLPAWLNEGIAMVTVDRFLGKQNVRPSTLDRLKEYSPKGPPPTYRQMAQMDLQATAYHTLRGYWLVRYLLEKSPNSLRTLIAEDQTPAAIEEHAAGALGIPVADL